MSATLTPAGIAEVVLRLTESHRTLCARLGEPADLGLLGLADECVDELARPPSVDEMASLCALVSSVGEQCLKKIGEVRAARN